MNGKNEQILREELAEYAHEAWSGWMKYLFEISLVNDDGTVTIPVGSVNRWLRQSITSYKDLTRLEKESDRDEADRIIKIIKGADHG